MSIITASRNGNIELVRALIDNYGVDTQDYDGRTALLMASMYGHIDIVELLLKSGANINKKDGNGYTALYWATARGFKNIIRLLLKSGADTNIINNNGSTALFRAADNKNKKIMALLLKYNADPNIGENQYNPLFFALVNNNKKIILFLIQAGAKTNMKHINMPLYLISNTILFINKCLFIPLFSKKFKRMSKDIIREALYYI
jgi:ankyrin repeat protein